MEPYLEPEALGKREFVLAERLIEPWRRLFHRQPLALRQRFRIAYAKLFGHDCRRERGRIGSRQESAPVARSEGPLIEEDLHPRRQIEETERVRDMASAATKMAGKLVLRPIKFV